MSLSQHRRVAAEAERELSGNQAAYFGWAVLALFLSGLLPPVGIPFLVWCVVRWRREAPIRARLREVRRTAMIRAAQAEARERRTY